FLADYEKHRGGLPCGRRREASEERHPACLSVLAFANIVTYCWGGTLFADSRLMYLNTAPVIEWKMLFKFSTFIYALLFCLALNLLSSGWPAWRASRMSIINALSGKLN
ncbi:hypothetical protein ACIXEI_23325, partial [Bacteroides fragilis]